MSFWRGYLLYGGGTYYVDNSYPGGGQYYLDNNDRGVRFIWGTFEMSHRQASGLRGEWLWEE